MSKITQLELLVKKARKRGSNKIVLELDFAKALITEIDELSQVAEPEVPEVIEVEPASINIELQGGRFKED